MILNVDNDDGYDYMMYDIAMWRMNDGDDDQAMVVGIVPKVLTMLSVVDRVIDGVMMVLVNELCQTI